jgi:uncharacterized membrane protein YccC
MATPTSATVTLRSACADWTRTDGATWLYLAKLLCAAFLALWLSMRLELSAPSMALTTVFIVTQPQSGAVFSKSFYRLCGTYVGLVVTLVCVSLFAQARVPFLIVMVLWVAVCTAGAASRRGFQGYGFVLAGYTVAMIGLPAAQQANDAFMTAMTRVSAVTVGIFSAAVASALLFPRYKAEQMRTTIRERLTAFIDYVSAALSGQLDRAHLVRAHTRFVADIVGFEAARNLAMFEGPLARLRGGQMARLNREFMIALSRFHTLTHLLRRFDAAPAQAPAGAALAPCLRDIAPLLALDAVDTRTAVAQLAARLLAYRDALSDRLDAIRATVAARPAFPLADFDLAADLLTRFSHDLHAYVSAYASLAGEVHAAERWIEPYQPSRNRVAGFVAGVRATVATGLVAVFWIATAWPSGIKAVSMTAIACALCSTFPRPTAAVAQMAVGATLSALLGMVLMFGVYPRIDGFPLLCAALACFIAPGVWLAANPRRAAIGSGYLMFLSVLAGPTNVIRYDPAGYMNDAIGYLLALPITFAAFAIVFPPDGPWFRRRLLADLRRQVVAACREPLGGLRTRFESRTRDLMSQADTLAADQPGVRDDALRWMFAVLETGNAVIDLRETLAAAPGARPAPWRPSVKYACDAVAALFAKPSRRRFETARAALDDALVALARQPDAIDAPRAAGNTLHLLRGALLDPASPLAAYQPAPESSHLAPS